VLSQGSGEKFVCLWVGCKVYNQKSCSRTWLTRHVLSHAGSKPYRYITLFFLWDRPLRPLGLLCLAIALPPLGTHCYSNHTTGTSRLTWNPNHFSRTVNVWVTSIQTYRLAVVDLMMLSPLSSKDHSYSYCRGQIRFSRLSSGLR